MLHKESTPRRNFIDLKGPSGNAFAIINLAKNLCNQLKENDPEYYNWDVICSKMRSGDYYNLVSVFEDYFGDYVDIYGVDESFIVKDKES